MAECNSIECNSVECNSTEKSNLNNQQFRLNKINEIKDYFIVEIKKRELMSKRFSILLLLMILMSLELFYQQQVVAFLLHHLQQLLEDLYE